MQNNHKLQIGAKYKCWLENVWEYTFIVLKEGSDSTPSYRSYDVKVFLPENKTCLGSSWGFPFFANLVCLVKPESPNWLSILGSRNDE